VSQKSSIKVQALSLFGFVFLIAGPAVGETCSDCQKRVQSEMATCVSKLPRIVKYPDVRGKTDADRKLEAEHAEKARACSKAAQDGYADCRKTAQCP